MLYANAKYKAQLGHEMGHETTDLLGLTCIHVLCRWAALISPLLRQKRLLVIPATLDAILPISASCKARHHRD